MKIAISLEVLNVLIASGWAFPDACYRVATDEGISYAALSDAYDAQFN